MVLTAKTQSRLRNQYFDPSKPGSFSGAAGLRRAVGGHPEAIAEFLKNHWAYSLHKPVRKNYIRRRYVTSGLNRQWQADLVEMQPFARENKGYRYLLTAIDIFSRYAYARPLKDKTGKEVASALRSMFEENKGISPSFLQTDQGKEFYNSHVKQLLQNFDVELFSVYSDYKAAVCERFNKTLKDRMYRYFTYKGNHKWVDVLPQLVHSYNNSYHRSLERTPASITSENAMESWVHQYETLKKGRPSTAKFSIGDRVRISKARGVFTRGFLPGWSDEVFTVHEVNSKYAPLMYSLQDSNGEILDGRFYAQELQKVEGDLHRIEKILKTTGQGKKKKAYVKWMGYKTPTWILYEDIQPITGK